ncbi:MAG: AAA family ATPase, partial [Candidatus Hydrogenedentota bacterium]
MKKLPIGIQDFPHIRQEGYIYVDKTSYLYRLITEGKVYFLSRPRRFGKSLLVSTLEQIFRGNQALFEGLYIHDKIEWKEHPVIKLDMTQMAYRRPEELETALVECLQAIGREYGVAINGRLPKDAFANLVTALSPRGKVALLIDEYDKPIIGALPDTVACAAYRDLLKDFYGVIKGLDAHLKFVFLTGVSKFSRTSIFSDLNNLYDLTMDREFSAVLGYTQVELESYFAEHIDAVSTEMDVTPVALKEKMEHWYNGYRFSIQDERVYNPFSMLSFFRQREFRNYWFATGTPTFLIKLMRERNFDLSDLEHLVARESTLGKYEVEKMQLIPLLFQTGYLTIDAVERDEEAEEVLYHLRYPNREVERSMLDYFVAEYMGVENGDQELRLRELRALLKSGSVAEFLEAVQGILAGIPHTLVLAHENYYSSIIYTILKM